MKALLIGPGPGRSGTGEPLAGRCGQRLASLCGLELPAFLEAYDRVNLLPEWPGKAQSGRGDAFPLIPASMAAIRMVEDPGGDFFQRPRIVVLGWNVAKAFRLPHHAYFHWWPSRDRMYWKPEPLIAVAPHPSGINTFWNAPANVEAARDFWMALTAELHPEPEAASSGT